jgi:RNA polymerase sigma-70 factor (ECF subfamily)
MSLRLTGAAVLPIPRTASVVDPANGQHELKEEIVALFDDLRGPLLRYLSSFGLALCDGEEVIQEAFLALFQHLRAGKPRDNLRGWLFRVTHNLALKRRYRERRGLEALTAMGALEDVAVDPAPSMDECLVNKETQHRLMAVLEALSEQDRRCLILRAEGLRYREIGEILSISLGAVSLSLARSLARMGRAAGR